MLISTRCVSFQNDSLHTFTLHTLRRVPVATYANAALKNLKLNRSQKTQPFTIRSILIFWANCSPRAHSYYSTCRWSNCFHAQVCGAPHIKQALRNQRMCFSLCVFFIFLIFGLE